MYIFKYFQTPNIVDLLHTVIEKTDQNTKPKL